jgi:hypothetical protein
MRTKAERAAISRANGSKSRGPRTAEGKAISSRNALKHGLTSRKIVVEGTESEREFKLFTAAMKQHYQPQNIMEALWVDRITVCMWRARRVPLEEANLIEDDQNASFCGRSNAQLPNNLHKLKALVTYEERLIRQVQTAIRELEKLRGEEKSEEAPLLSPTITINSPALPEE